LMQRAGFFDGSECILFMKLIKITEIFAYTDKTCPWYH